MSKPRIAGVDSLRGLMLLLMVVTHLAYDLTLFGWFPAEIYFSSFIQALIALGAGIFILISGAMARFSRSNIRRGVRYLLAGLAVTAVTLIFPQNGVVWFGILHLLGISALLYAVSERFLLRIPPQTRMAFCLLALFGSAALTALPVTFPGAWLLGFTHGAPAMADFFPVLPWLFVYLLGTIAGERLQAGLYPDWFGRWDTPGLRFVSQYALPIYLLHQPVMLGLLLLIRVMII
ncbi:MAG: DUF1624 domain-containing protein [Ruminococcaceae bacterium]|nr:DUF1624 domain-containing protein [Oscillospiraceae bacterium]